MAADAVVFERFEHPQLGFWIDLPVGVQIDVDVPPGIALTARESPGATRAPFRAELTVAGERLSAGTDLETYAEGSSVQLGMFDGFHLLDRAPTEVGGRPAVRTLGHVVSDGLPLVVQRWCLVDGDRGWAVAASCDVFDFPHAGDTLATCARSLQLPDVAA
jgi:hypothetical protein